MIKIKGLDDRVIPILTDGLTQEQLAQAMTYRKVFVGIISNSIAKSGEEAIELVQLGLKLKLTEPEVDIEDSEFKLLKKTIDENKNGILNTLLQGSALILLNKCESESKKK